MDGVDRIRFTTSHPVEFTDSLVQAYAPGPSLSNYVYLPVQHGSDRILAAMKRNHTALEYKSRIRRLRELRPDISMSSDFIIGFPGETEEDFAQLLDFIEEAQLDRVAGHQRVLPGKRHRHDLGRNLIQTIGRQVVVKRAAPRTSSSATSVSWVITPMLPVSVPGLATIF